MMHAPTTHTIHNDRIRLIISIPSMQSLVYSVKAIQRQTVVGRGDRLEYRDTHLGCEIPSQMPNVHYLCLFSAKAAFGSLSLNMYYPLCLRGSPSIDFQLLMDDLAVQIPFHKTQDIL